MIPNLVSLEEIESALSGKTGKAFHRAVSPKERYFHPGDVFENENMKFDLHLGEELILKLYNSYVEATHMFAKVRSETHAPQHLFIPGYDKEHILWLFFATLTDRRQKSGGPYGVYASHCKIFADRPELYSEYAATLKVDEFGNYLKKFKIGVPNQSALYWKQCARTLFYDFDGDPVKMFSSIGSDVRAVQKFKNDGKKIGNDPLPGYGPKITSLYSLFLHEIKAVLMPEDAFPVDVQVQRVFIQSRAILKKGDVSNALMEKVLRQYICLIAKFHNLDKIVVSHSFWLLGSEGCNGCPGKQNAPVMCPMYEMCHGCENTASYFAKGKWALEDRPMNKGGQQIIEFGMPGIVPQRYTRKKREATPQLHLFNGNLEEDSTNIIQ